MFKIDKYCFCSFVTGRHLTGVEHDDETESQSKKLSEQAMDEILQSLSELNVVKTGQTLQVSVFFVSHVCVVSFISHCCSNKVTSFRFSLFAILQLCLLSLPLWCCFDASGLHTLHSSVLLKAFSKSFPALITSVCQMWEYYHTTRDFMYWWKLGNILEIILLLKRLKTHLESKHCMCHREVK